MSEQLPMPALPTGNRLAVVTPDDNSAPVLVVTILSLIFSFVTLAIRLLVVKWKRYGRDDLLVTLAHIVAVFQWVLVFYAEERGLGKALKLVEKENQLGIGRSVFAARLLLIVALCLSKISILLVTRSLFQWEKRRRVLLIDGAIFLSTAWGVAAILAVSVNCSPRNGVADGDISFIPRLQAVIIFDVVTECIIFALPPIFLHGFEISSKKSFMIITAFGSRLPLAVLSIFYLLAYTQFIKSGENGVAYVPTILWQEILIGYSLMSATIPCLRNFVEGFKTGGMSVVLGISRSGDHHGSSGGSYQMSFLSKRVQAESSAVQSSTNPASRHVLAAEAALRFGPGSQEELIGRAV